MWSFVETFWTFSLLSTLHVIFRSLVRCKDIFIFMCNIKYIFILLMWRKGGDTQRWLWDHVGMMVSKHGTRTFTKSMKTHGCVPKDKFFVSWMRALGEVSLWHRGSMQTSPWGHFLCTDGCSALCFWKFSLRSSKENSHYVSQATFWYTRLLQYLFRLSTKKILGTIKTPHNI